MGDATAIEWATATWNPWQGCRKVSAGCKHCYMYREKSRYGQNPGVVVKSKTVFNAPLKWREPEIVFVCSGVPFFFKQWGGLTSKAGGRVLDGRTWDEYPEVSRGAAVGAEKESDK